MIYRNLLILAAIAAFLNIIPLLLVVPAGDVIMNYVQLECYSKQIFNGIFYPRWCMEANAGAGSPAPIFYFPLPFYITTLFAPLKYFGLTTENQYLLGVYLANFTAFICSYFWLSRFVSKNTALFCAFIFLFGFYRAEIITRASYAEYWCISFAPLIFMLAHDACHLAKRNWRKFALVITISMLCHAPVTIIMLIGAGLYIMIMNWRAIYQPLIGGIIATIITLPHYLPMRTLADTLNPELGGVSFWQKSWINSTADKIFKSDLHNWVLLASSISLLAFIFLLVVFLTAFLSNQKHLPEINRKQGKCWIFIGIFALFMMFSPSLPLWNVIKIISSVSTPWRMQGLAMFSLIAIFALLSEHLWFKNKKTMVGDRASSVLFFVFVFIFYSGGVKSDSITIHQELIKLRHVLLYFATRDTDKIYKDVDLFYNDFVVNAVHEQAAWKKGSGKLDVKQWNEKGIIIKGNAENKQNTMRLWHYHYPIWQAELNGKEIAINPEKKSGFMLIEVPKGDFELNIRMNYWQMLYKSLHRSQ